MVDYLCPKCKSERVVKAGKAIRRGGTIQARQCKDCGYRSPESKFTIIEKPVESTEEKEDVEE